MDGSWSIIFEGPTKGVADDFTLAFSDVREIFGNYVGFQSEVYKELLSNFNKFEHYHAVGNIKKVMSPEQEDFSDRPIVALLGIDKNELKFGILLYLGETDTIILGLWPKQFFNAVKEDENILVGTLVAFLRAPDNWKRVDLITSQTQETKEAEERE